MDKRWVLKSVDERKAARLQASLNIHPVLCRLLVQRGAGSFEEARQFFRPSLDSLYRPWLMKDIDRAVERVESAISRKERILVYGDYDVDGTTAVAVVYSFLKTLCPDIHYYVPHRYREGYGISTTGIDYAKAHGYTLIIALDCGINAMGQIEYGNSLGIDCIVCDHHQPSFSGELPPAVAVLDPGRADCPYPYKTLSGCGIGFKLISALAEKRGLPAETVNAYLGLAAISIAADIVPLDGENRILAHYGLKRLNECPPPGIGALLELGGWKKQASELTIRDLVFLVAPRINAAGRMDHAGKAVQLFIEKDPETARRIARMLDADNTRRKEMDSSITKEALEMIESDRAHRSGRTTVVYKPHWHKGVVGIVAARLVETGHRPTIVLTASNGKLTGSARSIPGFNIYEALCSCRDLLENYGGHFYAAGLTLKPENLDAFRVRFEEAAAVIPPGLMTPELPIDAEISLNEITPSFYRILRQFEPSGPGNPCPVFLAKRVTDNGYSRIVKEHHIRFVLQQKDAPGTGLTGIGFGLAHKFEVLAGQRPFDIAFTVDENEWNGDVNLQMKVVDIRAST